jgi:hypothetical protein
VPLKRIRRGEALPGDAPELGTGLPPTEYASWNLEDVTYARLGRQLRCVGDALAWRVTGYDRAFILALGMNASAGPIVNKAGLDYELGFVTEAFRDRGHFVLLHDLTNCVRIGDATEFTADGNRWLREVKKTGRSDTRQTARMQQVVDALMDGAPLPRAPDARIVRLETPLRTHLSSFRDALVRGDDGGLAGVPVPGGSRAIICASIPAMVRKPDEDWVARWESQRARLQRRLGLTVGTDELVLNTGDTAAHTLGMAPFGIFPIEPGHAAQLICDFSVTETRMAVVAVTAALQQRGLEVHFSIGGRSTQGTPEQATFHVRQESRVITLHGNAVVQLLLEHVTLESLTDSITEMLDCQDPPREPVPIYAREDHIWS